MIQTESCLDCAPLFSADLIVGFLFVCSSAGVSGTASLTGGNVDILGRQNFCVEAF